MMKSKDAPPSHKLDTTLTYLFIAHTKGVSVQEAAKRWGLPLMDVQKLWWQWSVK